MIRVGLAGYGLAGSVFHDPLIRASSRLELTAVLTSREAPHRVGSLDELIGRSDLVVVATPNATHFDIAMAALRQGKHVAVDKPLAVTPEEAERLASFARERGLVLTVFHNRRWDSDFLTVRHILPQLGDVSLFEAHWDRFRPSIKPGWKEVDQPGSGLTNDLAPHMIDQALVLFGVPDAVSAELLRQRPDAQVDDYFEIGLHYGARRVNLRSSTLIAAPRPRFSIHGTGGSFVKHGLDPQEAQLKAGMKPDDAGFGVDKNLGTLTLASGEQSTTVSARGDYRLFYEAVADAILDGAPVPVSPADAITGLQLIDLARRASEEGRVLPVPGSSSKAEPSPED